MIGLVFLIDPVMGKKCQDLNGRVRNALARVLLHVMRYPPCLSTFAL